MAGKGNNGDGPKLTPEEVEQAESDAALPVPRFSQEVLEKLGGTSHARRGGRPVIAISEQQTDEMCKAITSSFCFPSTAAITSGVSERSFQRWRTYGQRDIRDGVDSPYAMFWRAIARADNEAERSGARTLRVLAVDLVKEIETTVQKKDGSIVVTKKPILLRAGNANAAIALMEKRYQPTWGRQEKVEHVIIDKGEIERAAEKAGVSVAAFTAAYEKTYGKKLEFANLCDDDPAN